MESGYGVTLFPLIHHQRNVDLALPGKRLAVANLISFGSDGRSAYIDVYGLESGKGTHDVLEIEFSPTRLRKVPGFEELGGIAFITLSSSPPGRIFVSTFGSKSVPCGAYEVDPNSGPHRLLRPGVPNCTASIGADFSRWDTYSDQRQREPGHCPAGWETARGEVNDWRGASRGIGPRFVVADGQWIADSGNGRIALIRASDLSRRKWLGTSGMGDEVAWSPDSRFLLVVKQDFRCFMLNDAETVMSVDVQTGRRTGHRRGTLQRYKRISRMGGPENVQVKS